MTEQRLTITAETNADGKWILADNGGNTINDGIGYKTKREAIESAKKMFPTNSLWHGRDDGDGWSIVI